MLACTILFRLNRTKKKEVRIIMKMFTVKSLGLHYCVCCCCTEMKKKNEKRKWNIENIKCLTLVHNSLHSIKYNPLGNSFTYRQAKTIKKGFSFCANGTFSLLNILFTRFCVNICQMYTKYMDFIHENYIENAANDFNDRFRFWFYAFFFFS